jgi:outer membrane receptor for ferrienterochelin and colicins
MLPPGASPAIKSSILDDRLTVLMRACETVRPWKRHIPWLLLLGAAPAAAQVGEEIGFEKGGEQKTDIAELSLEDLLNSRLDVWSATKSSTKIEQVAAAVTVVSASEMRLWGYQSLSALLQHVVGFYVIDDFSFPNVVVRGLSGGLWAESNIIKVMIDGHAVPFRLTGGHWLGPELIPLTAIERIEIIRGPVSALYGADAFTGVINIITRQGSTVHGAVLEAGPSLSNGRLSGNLDGTLGAQVGPVQFTASARYNKADFSGLRLPDSSPAPTLPSYAPRSRIAEGLINESTVAHARIQYEANNTAVSLAGYYSAVQRAGAFSPWAQLTTGRDERGRLNGSQISLQQGQVILRGERHFTEHLDISLDVVTFFGGTTPRDSIDVGSELYVVQRTGSFAGVDGTLEARLQLLENLNLTAGVQFVFDREQLPSALYEIKARTGDHAAGTVVEEASVRQGIQDFVNPAPYLQAIWTPSEKYLQVTSGIRYDHHNIYGSQLVGRLGLVSNPFERFTLKLLYGSAFKAPSPLLLYGTPLESGDIVGNPALKAQYIHNLELQVSWAPRDWIKLLTRLSYSLVLDKAEFTQRGVDRVAENLASVTGLSSESRVDLKPVDWLQLRLGFETQKVTRQLGNEGYYAEVIGSENVIAPAFQLRTSVMATPPKVPLAFTLQGIWVGPRRASDFNILEHGASYNLPAYYMLDGAVSYSTSALFSGKATGLSLSCQNLLNVVAADPGFAGVDYPLRSRTFMLQLRQEL